MAHGVDLVFSCGDPSHCCLLTAFQFCCFGHLLFQSNFSPMAFFVLGLPSQDLFCSGSFLRRSSCQLIPTDFAILKHSSIRFLILANFFWGAW